MSIIRPGSDFFKIIDSEIKSYYLGIILSDGWINNQNRVVSYLVSEKDKSLLEPLTKIFNIKIHERKGSGYSLLSDKKYYYINICNKKVCDDLKSFGITIKKSNNEKIDWSRIPKNLLNHFIRGYFDGDGCITTGTYNITKCCISIVGNKTFLLELSKEINSGHIIVKPTFSVLQIQNRQDAWKFYQYLYKDATIYLIRKKEKFDNFPWNCGKYKTTQINGV